MRTTSAVLVLAALLAGFPRAWAKSKPKSPPPPSPLSQYIEAAKGRASHGTPTPGSLYTPEGRLGELSRDLRASQIDDIVTIVVADRASAVSRGATNTGRTSSAKAAVTSVAGPLRAAGPLTDLLALNSDQKLQGQGETSRESELTTTLSARVVDILPNGNLVLEGTKEVLVNSERQRVIVRGVARWNDVDATNRLRSDRLAQLEVWIDGRGVVNDSIRRPWFLYRILLGLLPF